MPNQLYLFVYLEKYSVLVCKLCQYSIIATAIQVHLRQNARHSGHPLPNNVVRALEQRVEALPVAIRSSADISTLRPPPPTTPAIPLLAPPRKDRYSCL
ncbi:hypothetical protein F5Y07DRAFT_60660 [Xylaria sp. FL0933]|nr:hypothetical protein F5Y07DRAFT_60660 [Xylaria sp. FL0933]